VTQRIVQRDQPVPPPNPLCHDLGRELGSLKLDDLKNAGHDAVNGASQTGSSVGSRSRACLAGKRRPSGRLISRCIL